MIQISLTVNKQRFRSYLVKICYVIHLISIDACITYMSLCMEIQRKMYSSKASSKFSGGCRLFSTIYTGRKCRYHTEDGFETYTHFDRFLCGFDQLLSRDLWHGTSAGAYTEQQGDHLGSSDSLLV